ncbi:hypothetical protein ACFLRM_02580, partial [Acidobacteriota bacterium]
EKQSKKTAKSPSGKINVTEGSSLKDLIEKTKIETKELLEKLRSKGHNINVNDFVNESLTKLISEEFDLEIEIISIEKETQIQAQRKPDELVARPSVVNMAHNCHNYGPC